MFVEESVKEEFLDKVVSRTKSIRVGDPMEPQTQMGALISSDHLEKVLRYVQIGKDEVRTGMMMMMMMIIIIIITSSKNNSNNKDRYQK